MEYTDASSLDQKMGVVRKKILISAGYAPSLINFRGPLIKAFLDRGMDVVACAGESDDETVARLKSIGVVFYPLKSSRTGMNPFSDLFYVIELIRIILSERPDIVLGYTHKAANYAAIASWITGTQNVYMMVTGLGHSFLDNRELKRKLVCLYIENLYRVTSVYCRRIFFQNKDDSSVLIKCGAIDPDRIVHVNGSGVDMLSFPYTPVPRAKRIRFLLVSRLLKHKGIREYVQAIKRLREDTDCEGVLVGPLEANPDTLDPRDLELWKEGDYLTYLGPRDDIYDLMKDTHVYVLPSYREGTPRSVLEAMSVGRAIITCNSPGCRTTVKLTEEGKDQRRRGERVMEGENGFQIRPRSADSVYEAMMRFVENRSLIERMGNASRRIAEAKFDVNKVNADILNQLIGPGDIESGGVDICAKL